MQEYREKPGTKILIGAPAIPVSQDLRRCISEVICNIEEIREAHLPDVITIGSGGGASRVLFLVFEKKDQISQIMDSIGPELADAGRTAEQFEVWPISQSNDLLETIRDANCVIGWRD